VGFWRSIGSNISGPMPPESKVLGGGCVAGLPIRTELLSRRQNLIRRLLLFSTTIVCCVNKKSAIDHHCRLSQVLDGTR
jgi:hypothetical protein